MCLSGYNKFLKSCTLLLLIALVLKSNLITCDIITNSTNIENHTAPIIQCKNNSDDGVQEDCILRDRHVVIVKKIDSYLNEPSSIYSSYAERLKHTSILYGLVRLAQENELNQKCYNEIMQINDGIKRKEIWAMKSKFQHLILFFFYLDYS
jgi:hypothetical protein